MSVLMCSPDHIGVIAAFVGYAGEMPTLPEKAHARVERGAVCLATTNIAAYEHRYRGEHPFGDSCGAEVFVKECVHSARMIFHGMLGLTFRPSPGGLAKQLDCYEYQCCELPDWEGSEAKEIVDRARRLILRGLEDYEQAAWGISSVSEINLVKSMIV